MRRSMALVGGTTEGEASLVYGGYEGLCCGPGKARVKVMKNSVNGRRKC